MDLDIEIKFTIGSHRYSIDVHKKYLAELKKLYKALIQISTIQEENAQYFEYARNSLDIASRSVNRASSEKSVHQEFRSINDYTFKWLTHFHSTYNVKDFSEVFAAYL